MQRSSQIPFLLSPYEWGPLMSSGVDSQATEYNKIQNIPSKTKYSIIAPSLARWLNGDLQIGWRGSRIPLTLLLFSFSVRNTSPDSYPSFAHMY